MKKLIYITLFVALCLLFSSSNANAENWAFKRSYYSHEIPQQIAHQFPRPVSRSAYRLPIKSSQGIAIRGGYRYNHVYLRSGNSVDHTVLWEGWFGVQP